MTDMKRLFVLLALTLACSSALAQTQIVAHRGMWKGNAQNSIASLKAAQDFGCWGSEFDVHLTADDVVVVNHDATIGGTNIQTSSSKEVCKHTLKNGEHVSTLDQYLTQGALDKDCILVMEIKPHYNQEREDKALAKCLEGLEKHDLMNPARVVFISFSYHICKELARMLPDFTVQYLEGDKTPTEVYADGINGIDYHYSHFKKHPEWVKEAHDLGMSVNAWTVDKADDLRQMRDLGVDQITTNDPILTQEILREIQ